MLVTIRTDKHLMIAKISGIPAMKFINDFDRVGITVEAKAVDKDKRVLRFVDDFKLTVNNELVIFLFKNFYAVISEKN